MISVKSSNFNRKLQESGEVELEQQLAQERENLYKLRQQLALKQLDNPKAVTTARKNIARILTEIRAREMAHKGN